MRRSVNQRQTILHTKNKVDEENEESLASSYHITIDNGGSEEKASPKSEDDVKLKVHELMEAGFIRKVKYSAWIPSIVLVRNKI